MRLAAKLIFLVFVFVVLSATPVHAGWLDFLFKGAAKHAEKQIVKQEEKIITKQAEKSAIKQEEKQITKQEQILVNKKAGDALDDAFKTAWCKYSKCVTKFTDIRVSALGTDTVYITDDYAAQKFIQNNYLLNYASVFNRRPDMLRIKTTDGKVTSIVIYDVKTSTNAVVVAEQRGQGQDYLNFCQTLNIQKGKNFCKVQYILPKEEIINVRQTFSKADDGTLACSTVSLGIDVAAGALRGGFGGPVSAGVGAATGVAMCFIDGSKLLEYVKYISSD